MADIIRLHTNRRHNGDNVTIQTHPTVVEDSRDHSGPAYAFQVIILSMCRVLKQYVV